MQFCLMDFGDGEVLMMREDATREWRPAPVTRWEEGGRAIIAQQPEGVTFSRQFSAKVIR